MSAEKASAPSPSLPSVSEARLYSVLDTAVDGIVVIDDRARILMFNKACESLFGRTAEEVFGRNVSMLMPDEFSRSHDGYVRNYLETGERRIIGVGREVRAMHRDGSIFPIELSVGEAKTPDGRQFIGIIRDLTSRKQVEHRLAQTQAQLLNMTRINAMDEMGAAIAHEVNQPLTAIMLYLQAIQRKTADAGALENGVREMIDKALKESVRAGHIIQRMRNLVEKREPERRASDVAALLMESVDLVRMGGGNEDLQFHVDVPDDIPELNVDPVQIQQVLVNLIRNAAEVVRDREDRKVWVFAYSQERDIVICVRDSGQGVPPEVAPDLFRAFAGAKRRGLGLGLAISRSIAQNHGGDLTVDPGGQGKGATFSLRLPSTQLVNLK